MKKMETCLEASSDLEVFDSTKVRPGVKMKRGSTSEHIVLPLGPEVSVTLNSSQLKRLTSLPSSSSASAGHLDPRQLCLSVKKENGTRKKRKLQMLNDEVSIRKVKTKKKVKKVKESHIEPDIIDLSSDSEDQDPLQIDTTVVKSDDPIDFGLKPEQIVIIPAGTPGLGSLTIVKSNVGTPGLPTINSDIKSNVGTPAIGGLTIVKSNVGTPAIGGLTIVKSNVGTPALGGLAIVKSNVGTPHLAAVKSDIKSSVGTPALATVKSNKKYRGSSKKILKNDTSVKCPPKSTKLRSNKNSKRNNSDIRIKKEITKNSDKCQSNIRTFPIICNGDELDSDPLKSQHTSDIQNSTECSSDFVVNVDPLKIHNNSVQCKIKDSKISQDNFLDPLLSENNFNSHSDNFVDPIVNQECLNSLINQNNSVDPISNQENLVDPLESQKYCDLNQISSQENLVDPLEGQENWDLNPIPSQGNLVDPLESQENCDLNPISSQENLVDPLQDQENCELNPISNQENLVDPLQGQENCDLNPISSQENLIDPLENQENCDLNPISNQENLVDPLQGQENCDINQDNIMDSITSDDNSMDSLGIEYTCKLSPNVDNCELDPIQEDSVMDTVASEYNPDSDSTYESYNSDYKPGTSPNDSDSELSDEISDLEINDVLATVVVPHTDEELLRKFDCTPCSILLDQQEIMQFFNKETHTYSILKEKKKSSSSRKMYQCNICKVQKDRKGHLERHFIAAHTDNRPYECKICNKSYKFEYYLKSHQSAVHYYIKSYNFKRYVQNSIKKSGNSFICKICNITFNDSVCLDLHKSSVHEIKSDRLKLSLDIGSGDDENEKSEEENEEFNKENCYCKFCNRYYVSRSSARRHLKDYHNIIPVVIEKPKIKKPKIKKPKIKIYHCKFCSYNTKLLKNYTLHIKKHVSILPYTCLRCKTKFKELRFLRKHQKTHKNVESTYSINWELILEQNNVVKNLKNYKYKCKICNLAFKSEKEIDEHYDKKHFKCMSIHKCEYCSYITTRKKILSHHIETHLAFTPLELHFCKLCYISFKNVKDLYDHKIKYHNFDLNDSGTKKIVLIDNKFQCGECNRVFTSACNIAKHLHVHSLIKPKNNTQRERKCNICDIIFETQEHLAEHKNEVHTSNYINEWKVFMEMLPGVDFHDVEAVYQCRKCELCTLDKDTMVEHMEEKHIDKTLPNCAVCNYVSPNIYYLKLHMKKHIKNPICKLCKINCKSINLLIEHNNQYHSITDAMKSDVKEVIEDIITKITDTLIPKIENNCEIKLEPQCLEKEIKLEPPCLEKEIKVELNPDMPILEPEIPILMDCDSGSETIINIITDTSINLNDDMPKLFPDPEMPKLFPITPEEASMPKLSPNISNKNTNKKALPDLIPIKKNSKVKSSINNDIVCITIPETCEINGFSDDDEIDKLLSMKVDDTEDIVNKNGDCVPIQELNHDIIIKSENISNSELVTEKIDVIPEIIITNPDSVNITNENQIHYSNMVIKTEKIEEDLNLVEMCNQNSALTSDQNNIEISGQNIPVSPEMPVIIPENLNSNKNFGQNIPVSPELPITISENQNYNPNSGQNIPVSPELPVIIPENQNSNQNSGQSIPVSPELPITISENQNYNPNSGQNIPVSPELPVIIPENQNSNQNSGQSIPVNSEIFDSNSENQNLMQNSGQNIPVSPELPITISENQNFNPNSGQNIPVSPELPVIIPENQNLNQNSGQNISVNSEIFDSNSETQNLIQNSGQSIPVSPELTVIIPENQNSNQNSGQNSVNSELVLHNTENINIKSENLDQNSEQNIFVSSEIITENVSKNNKLKIEPAELSETQNSEQNITVNSEITESDENPEIKSSEITMENTEYQEEYGHIIENDIEINENSDTEYLAYCYECLICDLEFETIELLMDHKNLNHANNSNFRFTEHINTELYCDHCEYFTENIEELESHMEMHLNLIHTCKYCNEKFKYSSDLVLHEFEHNYPEPNSYINDIRASVQAMTYTIPQIHTENVNIVEVPRKIDYFNCSTCIFKTSDLKVYQLHIKAHKMEQKITKISCNSCNLNFINENELAIHENLVHNIIPDIKTENQDDVIAMKFNFECYECKQRFCSKLSLNHHLKRTHLMIECMCSYFAANELELQSHLEVRSELLVCTQCAQKCISHCHLLQHKNLKHPFKSLNKVNSKTEELFSCSECDYVGIHNEDLEIHINSVHIQSFAFVCRFCQIKFTSNESLLIHEEKVHASECNHTIITVEDTALEDTSDKVCIYQCYDCNDNFISKLDLENHIINIHNLMCEICDFTTINSYVFKSHCLTHPELCIHECLNCTLKFCTFHELQAHDIEKHAFKPPSNKIKSILSPEIKKEIKENVRKCFSCNIQLPSMYALQKHFASNHSDDDINCTKCSYIAKSPKALSAIFYHLKKYHYSRKNLTYTCSCCNLRFSTQKRFDGHMNSTRHKLKKLNVQRNGIKYKSIHKKIAIIKIMNEKEENKKKANKKTPIECDICRHELSNRRNLYNHITKVHKIIENELRCSYCKYKSTCMYELKKHTSESENHKPICCKICNTYYKTSDSLKNHTLKIHNTSSNEEEKDNITVKLENIIQNTVEKVLQPKKAVQRRLSNTRSQTPTINNTNAKHTKLDITQYPKLGVTKSQHPNLSNKSEHPKLSIKSQHSKLSIKLQSPVKLKPKVEIEHKCEFCYRTSNFKTVICTHLQNVHRFNSKMLKCFYCSYVTKCVFELKTHTVEKHSKHKPSICKVCPKLFKTNMSLSSHYKNAHPEINYQRSPAKIQNSKTIVKVKNKKSLHHENAKNVIMPNTCIKCNKCFNSARGLILHNYHKHFENDTSEKLKHCQNCNKEFNSSLSLKLHMQKYHNIKYKSRVKNKLRMFKCKRCTFITSDIDMLKTHRETHMFYPFLCKFCDAKFLFPDELSKHEKSIHSNTAEIKVENNEKTANTTEIKVENSENTVDIKVETTEKTVHTAENSSIKSENNDIFNETSSKNYNCKDCNHTSTKKGIFAAHTKMTQHNNIPNITDKTESNVITNVAPTANVNPKLTCHICKIQLKSEMMLMGHLKYIHHEKMVDLEQLYKEANEKFGPCTITKPNSSQPIIQTTAVSVENSEISIQKSIIETESKIHVSKSSSTKFKVKSHHSHKHSSHKRHHSKSTEYSNKKSHNSEIPNKKSHNSELSNKNSESPNKKSHNSEISTKTSESPIQESSSTEISNKNSESPNKKSHNSEISNKNSEIPIQESSNTEITIENTEIKLKDLVTAIQNKTKIDDNNKCHQCRRCFTNEETLKKHLNDKHDYNKMPYHCNLCTYSCKDKCKLNSHALVHTDDRIFKCEKCPAKFKAERYLKVHMDLVHLKLKTFYCRICNKSFNQKYKVKLHIDTKHKYGNVFKCPSCPFVTSVEFGLHRHLRKHKNNKPYVCSICFLRFKDLAILRNHQRILHLKEFSIILEDVCTSD